MALSRLFLSLNGVLSICFPSELSPILNTYFIPPLINFISPRRQANAAVLARLLWQPQLLGNAQLSIIHSRSLTDGKGECQEEREREKETEKGGTLENG